MNYTKELEFLLKILDNHKINTFFHTREQNISTIDLGLRQQLNNEHIYTYIENFLEHHIKPNSIYKVIDEFSCVYFLLPLPTESDTTTFIIGPYLYTIFDQNNIMQSIEQYNIPPQSFLKLQEIFFQIPILSDDTTLQTMIETFGEIVWGSKNQFQFRYLDHNLTETIFTLFPVKTTQDVTSNFDIHIYETYLIHENNLIQAVSQGNIQAAEEIMTIICTFPLSEKSNDLLRNIKNYAISINSIFRKTAEINTISPHQILKIASRFMHKIELCSSPESCLVLLREMARKYCLLIKNHSMKEYSPLIQQTIKQIDMDLTADLNLHTMAKYLNSNASYLSTQFKKATGSTYTEYVQKKRIEYAVFLLNTTSLQIQTIAQYCGISDLNYFSKLFKKYVHLSPSTYRKELSKLEK